MIKKILIGTGVVVVTAGIAFGVLYFIKPAQPAPITKGSASKKLVLDHSKDYGACTLLDTTSIKTALGGAAKNLQTPQNAGITSDKYIGDGVKNVVSDSQTCIYAFASRNSTETTLSATNGFTVKITMYANQAGAKAVIEQIKPDPAKVVVNSLGDIAFYNADTAAQGPGAVYNFELQVFNSNKSTSYTISQPAKGTTFTAESAKAALLLLAK